MPGSLSPDFLNEELLDDFAGDPELSSLDGDWSAEYGPSIEYEDPGAIAKRIQEKGRVQLFPTDFVHAAFKMPKSDGGYEDFSFEGRRHILSPYNTQAKRVLLVCARQTEKSTLLGNLALTYSCLVPAFKTLYVSPSAMQTKTFSNDRVKEPIETSPILRAYTTHKLSQNIFEKQFINRSKITLRYAFLNADRVRGIPAWMLLIDEIQDIISDNIPVIEHCLSHAPKEWRRFVYSGTPKSLDNTIEWYRANKSTQGEWMVPCDRCGSNAKGAAGRFWNILGEKNIGNKSLICEKCGEQLYPMHEDAQWGHHVAWHPKYAPFESYRINQLMVPWKDWDELLYEYHNNPRAKFLNESLGISYDSGLRPLTLGQVKNECNPAITMAEKEVKKYRQIGLVNPIFMGIDWGTGENTYTVITLGTYVDMKLRVFYVHRCTGDLLEPPKQLAFIKKLVQQFHVRVIGTDYGGGYDRNDDLMRAFGPDRLVKYQYLPRSRQKVSWQGKLGRFIVSRTEVMSDIFNAIKRHQFEFPRWEEFHAGGNAPYAGDMLNIYSEYDEQRHQIVYKHAPDKPDDTFHSLLYMTLGSMLIRPRPDIVTPRKEVSGEGRGHPMFDGDYDGTVDQD